MAGDWKEKLKEISEHIGKQEREKVKSQEVSGGMGVKIKGVDLSQALVVRRRPRIGREIEVAKPSQGIRDFGKGFGGISKKNRSTPPLPPFTGGDQRITVGLDYGTSFTKVCFRKELGGDDVAIYPLVFEKPDRSVLYPSSVQVSDGKLYFGQTISNAGSKTTMFPHVKVCLACSVTNGSSSCVSMDICPYRKDGLTPQDLMTFYLAWVMKEARRCLPDPLKRGRPSLLYNVGVPVKHWDDGASHDLSVQYGKISYDAWCLSEGITQGLDLALCKTWLAQLGKHTPPNPDESPIQLAPETSAAIVSYVNSTDSRPGLYCIVDIGAWTTDISFFRLTDVGMMETGMQRLSFYAADVWPKATNAIDDRLLKCILEFTGSDSIKIFGDQDIKTCLRNARERGRLEGERITVKTVNGNEDDIVLRNYMIEFARGMISETVRRGFSSTFKDARKKEPNPDSWQKFTLFLTGGGSCEACFSQRISERYGGFEPLIRSDILVAPTLRTVGGTDVARRMAVAAGLSYPLGVWPEQIKPSQVSDWNRRKVRPIPSADDEPG